MNRYWQRCPPVHVSVAAYLGWGKTEEGNDVMALMSSLPAKPIEVPRG